MLEEKDKLDQEFRSMKLMFEALDPLDDDARRRVIAYIISRFDVGVQISQGKVGESTFVPENALPMLTNESHGAPKFGTFAELFSAAVPRTGADKALLAGYWLQICEGAENFDSQSANKILKHLGEGLANVTNAIESLKNQRPQLALQLRKSGASQQARKTYMITTAGIKAVENMLAMNRMGG